MAAVRVVADSTCDVSTDYAAAHQLRIVPLKVIIGDESYADGIDIDPMTLYRRMRSANVVPRTSQPTPAEFEAVFREVGDDAGAIVCTTISAEMSGTYSSAIQARDALPELPIHVVDTRTVALAHRQIVEEVLGAVEGGADIDEVLRVIEAVKATQRLVFTVESLEYLRRGGRIGGARALLGSVLNIKPVLEVRDGKVEPLDRVRTFPKALDRLLEELRTAVATWGSAHAMVAHADNPEGAATVARRAAEITGEPVPVVLVGPVIGVHGGPGAIGFSFYRPI